MAHSQTLSTALPSFYQGASNFSIGTSNVTIHADRSQTLLGTNPRPSPPHPQRRSTTGTAKPLPPTPPASPAPASPSSPISSPGPNPPPPEVVLWLCGSVGSGKSAIAQSLAEDLAHAHRLAASFFFFRGSGERSRFARAKRYIMDAIGRFSGWSVSKQMEEFVYRPVQVAFNDKSPNEGDPIALTIVIDGLDECEDREEVEEFIEHLLSFVISSRIESHIQSLLETHSVRIENLSNYLPHADIHTLLTTTFTRAYHQNRVIRAYGVEWPSPLELETLLRHISGSFIFASTLLKYILSPPTSDGLTPMERLPLALLLDPGLDGLYASTLTPLSVPSPTSLNS
ncbi:hypothetical protein FA13DRAFT_1793438 [Coprinellus micaceus]|uniref:Nephrocystin 3-like N-terminal domain-containing protein n=1 Tax=Coprinellus micaceus TaxID=71717 RepID=A0A4Y7T5U9_COPMI|nr:hypothetical protein FA13DRAFT_1793438 [Coprinellus micaceus]